MANSNARATAVSRAAPAIALLLLACGLSSVADAAVESNANVADAGDAATTSSPAVTTRRRDSGLMEVFGGIANGSRNASRPRYESPPPGADNEPFRYGHPDPYCPRARVRMCVKGVMMRCDGNRQLVSRQRPRACNLPCELPALDLRIESMEHFVCLKSRCNVPTSVAPARCHCLRCLDGNLVPYIRYREDAEQK